MAQRVSHVQIICTPFFIFRQIILRERSTSSIQQITPPLDDKLTPIILSITMNILQILREPPTQTQKVKYTPETRHINQKSELLLPNKLINEIRV